MTGRCPHAARIEQLYRVLPARRAWLVLLLAQYVRRHGAMTVGDLIAEHTAGDVFGVYDVVRAIRAGERHGWLRLVAHDHARLVGLPLLEDLQASVPVESPIARCYAGAA